MPRYLTRAVVAFLACFFCTSAFAQAPLEKYLRNPEFRNPQLSPNGEQLAVLVPIAGRMNLAAMDLGARKAVGLTNFGNFDVVDFHWVGNDRVVFSLGQIDRPPGESFGGGGLFSIRRDGSEMRELSPINNPRALVYFRPVPGSDEEILATARERSLDAVDVYRVNLRSGRRTLLTFDQPPTTVVSWVVDANLVPRAAVGVGERSFKFTVYYRASAEAKWEVLDESNEQGDGAFQPVYIDPDGKSLVVLARVGTDTEGLHRYDLATRKITEKIAHHPRFDMSAGSLVTTLDNRIIGFRLEAERFQGAWADEAYARLQRSVDNALPNRINRLQVRPAARRVLVTSYTDRAPAVYYLLDEAKKTMEELFRSRPWLKSDDLVEMRPFLLKTRDGLEIPSYVFVPKQRRAGERLPTVINIHGGPELRADTWGYESFGVVESQILASRGYAVVLPNFRITPGLGDRIHRAGLKQVGRKMQEDHEDATKWAVDEGIADPARICLYGASYGGYAALMGLVKTPDLYRCSVASFAVTDFESLMDSPMSVYNYNKRTPAYYKRIVGDPANEPELFRAIAPARNADKVKAPVFLIVGGSDPIVPTSQPYAMRRALQRENKPVKLLERPEESHGFYKLENQVDMMKQVLDFLDENIGTKAAK